MIQKLRTLMLVFSSVFLVNYFLNHNTGEKQETVGEWECEVEKLVDLQWKQRIYSDPKLSPYLEQINRASLRLNEAGLEEPQDSHCNPKRNISKRETVNEELTLKFKKLRLALMISFCGSLIAFIQFLRR